MAAKTTTSRFSFLTRILNLLAPLTLFAVIGILTPAVTVVYVNLLTAEMSRHLGEMEEHTDPSSPEYARLLQETQHDAVRFLVISIAVALVTLVLAFARKIVARFAPSSTTFSGSGDCYSLTELFHEVTDWRSNKPSLVIAAVVASVVAAVLRVASMALLGGNLLVFLFLAAFLAFLYLGILALTSVALRRKECSMLVLGTLLLLALLIPVCAVPVLYLYTEQVVGLGLSLLPVYDLLQGVQHMFYLSAANVYGFYYYYYQDKDMGESKEMLVACNEEKKI